MMTKSTTSQRREVERAQVLRHARAGSGPALADVGVRRKAGNQNVGLALGVDQVAQVTRMHHIEHAVAHDYRPCPRTRADDPVEFFDRLGLVAIALGERWDHETLPSPEILKPCLRRGRDRLRVPQRRVAPVVNPVGQDATDAFFERHVGRPAEVAGDVADVRLGAIRLAGTLPAGAPHRPAEQFDQAIHRRGLPAPRFQTSPALSVSAAARKAAATSVTWTKSRVCVPSPTTVKGSAGQFLRQEHAEHRAVRAGRARPRAVGVEDADRVGRHAGTPCASATRVDFTQVLLLSA